MMKIRLKDSKKVKAIFYAMSSIISETRLKVDPAKGLFITAMDGSHICLVNLSIKKEDMDEFVCDQPYELGVNLIDFQKLVDRAEQGDEIALIHDPKEKKMNVVLINENTHRTRKFTMALIDIDVEEINMDSLNGMSFDNNAKFLYSDMDIALKDSEKLSEVIQVAANENGIKLSTEGSIGNYENMIEKDYLVEYNHSLDSEGSFAVQFMKCIMQSSDIFGTTQTKAYKNAFFTIYLKSEAPVKVIVKILDNSEILYFTAPRVEEDTDSMYEDEPKTPVKVESPVPIQVPNLPLIPIAQFVSTMAAKMDYSDLKLQIAGKLAQISNAKSRIPELKEKLIECTEGEYTQIKKDYESAKGIVAEEQDINEMKAFLKL